MQTATAALTNRTQDFNGWTEIKGNPITKVGVFPYYGWQIDKTLEPDRIYNVFRPEEELIAPECIESFKLVPWIDNHEMLGPEYTPAEYKGIDGVTGETVYYEAPYLKANLKIFSEKLAGLVSAGKKELSIGYKCLYELCQGVYNGERYDAIQRSIRGNHLALVDEGRAGPDVAVLDHFKFTFDEALLMTFKKGLDEKDEGGESTGGLTIQELAAKLDEIKEPMQQMQAFMSKFSDMMAGKTEAGADEEAVEPIAAAVDADESETIKAMDAKIKALSSKLAAVEDNSIKVVLREVAQRDDLASRLAPVIGVFDHKEKSLNEVAQYAVSKIGLSCEKGQEVAILNGFLAGRQTSSATAVLDHAVKSSAIQDYINGGA